MKKKNHISRIIYFVIVSLFLYVIFIVTKDVKFGSSTSKNKNTSTSINNDSSTKGISTYSKKTISNAVNLKSPSGTFANVYIVTNADEEMSSTCNTSPEATCQIIFQNENKTVSLQAKKADGKGNVLWAWTPKSIGMTSGIWHIEAISVLDNQTKVTDNDPLTLELRI